MEFTENEKAEIHRFFKALTSATPIHQTLVFPGEVHSVAQAMVVWPEAGHLHFVLSMISPNLYRVSGDFNSLSLGNEAVGVQEVLKKCAKELLQRKGLPGDVATALTAFLA